MNDSRSASRSTSRTPRREGSAAPASRSAGGSRRRRARRGGLAGALNYPRAGKSGLLRWFPSLRIIVALCALGVLAGVAAFAVLYASVSVPKPQDVALAQTSTVYYSDGTTKIGTFGQVNRKILPADQIPDTVKKAVVASEDSTFYENRGVSPKGIARAFWNNISGGSRQGASTITQQYVKNYYTGADPTYRGKVKQIIMALKIDQELSKDEILSRYLNTIYFGRGAYGVQAASQAYFGKNAKDLDASEAALLVGIIPAPSAYDPAVNPKAAAKKWARVIQREVTETHTLTPAQADALQFPQTIPPKQENRLGGTNGYILKMVQDELQRDGFSKDEISTGGFAIVTTIDQRIQKNTVDAIATLPPDRPARNRVGSVTLDPSSGAIRGIYGGPDYVSRPRNDATQSHLQAGSTFKAITLVAALDAGYSLDSRWNGSSPMSLPGWKVSNFGNESYGRVDLRMATAHSINTAYAELNYDMGPKKTEEMAIRLGLPKNTPGLDADVTNVLGTASPTILNMAEVYATIAAKGVHHTPYVVQSVRYIDGKQRYEHKDDGRSVISQEVAINATSALEGPPSRGTARYVGRNMDGREVAGKTGTAESFRAAWFVGFTPQLVTAVGMFQPSEDGKSEEVLTPFGGVKDMTGGSFPAQLWVAVMKPSLKGVEKVDFPAPISSRGKSRSGSSSGSQAPRQQAPAPAPAPTTPAPAPSPTTPAPAPTTAQPTVQPTAPSAPSSAPSEPEGGAPTGPPTPTKKPAPSKKPAPTKKPDKPKKPEKPKNDKKRPTHPAPSEPGRKPPRDDDAPQGVPGN